MLSYGKEYEIVFKNNAENFRSSINEDVTLDKLKRINEKKYS